MTTAHIIKIISAIATLLTWLACVYGAIWALFFSELSLEPKALTAVVTLALAALLSFFLLSDYRYFFGKKNESK